MAKGSDHNSHACSGIDSDLDLDPLVWILDRTDTGPLDLLQYAEVPCRRRRVGRKLPKTDYTGIVNGCDCGLLELFVVRGCRPIEPPQNGDRSFLKLARLQRLSTKAPSAL